MKFIIAGALAALSLGAMPASAEVIEVPDSPGAFYVRTEVESDWGAGNYEQTVINTRVGYETEVGTDGLVYLEGGPAFVNPAHSDLSTEVAVELGGVVALSENLDLYGDVELRTNDGTNLNTWMDVSSTVGLTYSFR